MSTRSRIGILKKDGSIDSIYCHYDDYPKLVGLYKFYNENDSEHNQIIPKEEIYSFYFNGELDIQQEQSGQIKKLTKN